MDVYIPHETGEFVAFCAALLTMVLSLPFLFAPAASLRLLGLMPREGRRGVYAEARSTLGGFPLGLGLAAVLLAQPMVYLALGAAYALAAFGRLLAILSDDAGTLANWALLILQIALAVAPLAYVFGFL
ncbi:DUF4345 domain-containing protein [Xaviernesmea oryzae]|uniref:DUF4345 domain-containing protein n=1 Tax=Xaviernesmea oryzae TaxID=464029 RepID=A0A1Q9AVN9_9HYPH|nr:DUF4345 domain-containing protein [Xaviernesmea oryzae]OLP59527.1 DUF4345 domain-containing protein [Xaviernesmea oryzae]SEM14341.1 hypothetical protein SAMN04487976_12084 [Xaviernesmea oryzae]